ncbi:uroporphyrinogen-III synthase [Edaphobacter lichenicola]|uniref:Uroporphyrinogen-III synthase n=1 Tax=Tunturiibacter lichenicola TaxID=2051959 RepID=A0A7W8J4A6_9BACT|nr:uroporphyrinogen-III synthase [Edaphobacter lichenicola]
MSPVTSRRHHQPEELNWLELKINQFVHTVVMTSTKSFQSFLNYLLELFER